MRRFLPILIMGITVAFGLSQAKRDESPSNGSVEQKLIELERELSNALIRLDATTLDRLWSDDFIFTNPAGRISTKVRRLAGIRSSAQPTESALGSNQNDEVKVRIYGNTAVVTVLSTWRGKVNNQEVSEQYQATHVWTKQQRQWRLVAAHVSQVKK